MRTNMRTRIIPVIFVMVIAIMFSACGAVVAPGESVILLKPKGEPIIKHEGSYRRWGRTKAYFVDTKLASFPKDLKILCADEINMSVSVKWIGSFAVTDKTLDVIKKKVPAVPVVTNSQGKQSDKMFRLSLPQFFKVAMEDVLSSITRTVVSPYVTDNIREQRETIRLEIKRQFLERMAELKYPVVTTDVLITNLDYPDEVTTMRKAIKEAELRDLENAALAKAAVAKAQRNAELAMEEGKAELVRAQADAAANRERGASLTEAILAVKQLETLVKLAEGPNNSVVVIPFDAIKPGGLQETLITREAIDRLEKAILKK